MSIIDFWKQAVNPPVKWEENTDTDTEYAIWAEQGVVFLSFQGSSLFIMDKKIALDWKQNFSFWYVLKFIGGWLVLGHSGFIKKYLSISNKVMEHIQIAASAGYI